ncbi:MAG TPA: hypothetical protein VK446_07255 [Methylocystis sp.]|nr:hypothetical protein [Methylocystis sp.]
MFMPLSRFEESPWIRLLAPLAAAAALAAAFQGDARAAESPAPAQSSVYVLSDSEGYGLVDCIAEKRECGKIVADSWCEAHGHGPALSYGGAGDVTGAVSAKSRPIAGAAVVRCAD